ncbi:tol-pal system protein YbgF [Acidobacteriota bacterium]
MRKAIIPLLFILLFSTSAWPVKKETLQMLDGIEEIQRQLNELKRQTEKNAAMLEKLSGGLEEQVNDIRSSQAEINQQLDILTRENRSLNQKLVETGEKLAAILRSMEDGGLVAQRHPSRVTSTPMARSVYNNAYTDFSLGNWNLAIQGFEEYIEKYPQDDLTDNAQYWVGECYYSKRNYDRALQAFDSVIQNFPESDKVAEAHLKKGLIFIAQDRLAQAVLELQYVIDNYPDTPEAVKARERIREIGLSGR